MTKTWKISVNNMAGINAITYQTSNQPTMTAKQRQEHQEKVAAGVGGAAGLTTSATKMASKRGLQAEAGEKAYQQVTHMITEANKTVIKTSETATGLWSTFKANVKLYTKDITKRLEAFKNSKFIGPIVKSPIAKKFAALFGGALAFFVLVTGINKAFKTGEIAFDDLKNQYQEMRNM